MCSHSPCPLLSYSPLAFSPNLFLFSLLSSFRRLSALFIFSPPYFSNFSLLPSFPLLLYSPLSFSVFVVGSRAWLKFKTLLCHCSLQLSKAPYRDGTHFFFQSPSFKNFHLSLSFFLSSTHIASFSTSRKVNDFHLSLLLFFLPCQNSRPRRTEKRCSFCNAT